jgi:hypothetical protein
MQKVQESELIAALRSRKRELHESRLPFLSGGSLKGAVAFRVPTAEEEWLAQTQAAQHLAKHGAALDPERLEEIDFASVWLLSIAYRNAKPFNPQRPDILEPAFMPTQLLQLFTPDQLGEMIDEVMDKRAELAGDVFDEGEAANYADAIRTLDDEGIVELLASKPKSWLIALAAYLAIDGAPAVQSEPETFQFVATQ